MQRGLLLHHGVSLSGDTSSPAAQCLLLPGHPHPCIVGGRASCMEVGCRSFAHLQTREEGTGLHLWRGVPGGISNSERHQPQAFWKRGPFSMSRANQRMERGAQGP